MDVLAGAILAFIMCAASFISVSIHLYQDRRIAELNHMHESAKVERALTDSLKAENERLQEIVERKPTNAMAYLCRKGDHIKVMVGHEDAVWEAKGDDWDMFKNLRQGQIFTFKQRW